MSRPTPPILPTNFDEFSTHIQEHPSLWFTYFQNSYQVLETQETLLQQLQHEHEHSIQLSNQIQELQRERDLAQVKQEIFKEEVQRVQEQLVTLSI